MKNCEENNQWYDVAIWGDFDGLLYSESWLMMGPHYLNENNQLYWYEGITIYFERGSRA